MNVSVKTLGLHVNHMLDWKDKFEHVKNKMIVTIRKLMRTEIKTCQAHVFLICA